MKPNVINVGTYTEYICGPNIKMPNLVCVCVRE